MSAYARTSLLLSTPFRHLRRSLLNNQTETKNHVEKEDFCRNRNDFKSRNNKPRQRQTRSHRLSQELNQYPNIVSNGSSQNFEMSQMTMSQFSTESSVPSQSHQSYRMNQSYRENEPKRSKTKHNQQVNRLQGTWRQHYSKKQQILDNLHNSFSSKNKSDKTNDNYFETDIDCQSTVISQPLLPDPHYNNNSTDLSSKRFQQMKESENNRKEKTSRDQPITRKRTWVEACKNIITTPYRQHKLIKTSNSSSTGIVTNQNDNENGLCVHNREKTKDHDWRNETKDYHQILSAQEEQGNVLELQQNQGKIESKLTLEESLSKPILEKNSTVRDSLAIKSKGDTKISSDENNGVEKTTQDFRFDLEQKFREMKMEMKSNITRVEERTKLLENRFNEVLEKEAQLFTKQKELEIKNSSVVEELEALSVKLKSKFEDFEERSKNQDAELLISIKKNSDTMKSEQMKQDKIIKEFRKKHESSRKHEENLKMLAAELQESLRSSLKQMIKEIKVDGEATRDGANKSTLLGSKKGNKKRSIKTPELMCSESFQNTAMLKSTVSPVSVPTKETNFKGEIVENNTRNDKNEINEFEIEAQSFDSSLPHGTVVVPETQLNDIQPFSRKTNIHSNMNSNDHPKTTTRNTKGRNQKCKQNSSDQPNRGKIHKISTSSSDAPRRSKRIKQSKEKNMKSTIDSFYAAKANEQSCFKPSAATVSPAETNCSDKSDISTNQEYRSKVSKIESYFSFKEKKSQENKQQTNTQVPGHSKSNRRQSSFGRKQNGNGDDTLYPNNKKKLKSTCITPIVCGQKNTNAIYSQAKTKGKDLSSSFHFFKRKFHGRRKKKDPIQSVRKGISNFYANYKDQAESRVVMSGHFRCEESSVILAEGAMTNGKDKRFLENTKSDVFDFF